MTNKILIAVAIFILFLGGIGIYRTFITQIPEAKTADAGIDQDSACPCQADASDLDAGDTDIYETVVKAIRLKAR